MNLIFINDFQIGKSRFVQKPSVCFNVKIKLLFVLNGHYEKTNNQQDQFEY